MKKTCIVFKSNDSALVRRFGRKLKSRYNVEFPSAEMRGADTLTVRWDVAYHNDWVFGSSESKLDTIARVAMAEHWGHANPSEETWADWEIYSM